MAPAWPTAWAALLFLSLASPLDAHEDAAADAKTALAEIQVKDQELQDIGWRLVSGNAAFCDSQQVAIGLQLLDIAAFGQPDQVRHAMQFDGDFAIQTSAKGSPADQAGLRPNTEVFAINRRALTDRPAKTKGEWRRLAEIHDEIDSALNQAGQVSLTLQDHKVVTLLGVPVCATRFELADAGKRAVADGRRVQIGALFPAHSYAEDEFAAVIAHELAHNLLGHRVWLDKVGRSRKNVRATEREADRLMPWLLANAGYDPQASLRFMRRWGPRHDGGVFRKRTHEGWDERSEHIADELEGMQQFIGGGGRADWRQHFTRETGAD